jgi:3-oxoacyl-[acyl-carrier protein] reductase
LGGQAAGAQVPFQLQRKQGIENMDLRIAGKNALVMGGSKGIGRACAERLAREGCAVGVVARGQAAIDETVHAIKVSGGKAIGISADITKFAGYNDTLEVFRRAFGTPDIVVFSPPSPNSGEILTTDERELDSSYNDLVLCFLRLAKLTIPAMKEKQWGRFVTIGSGSTKYPMVGQWGFHYAQANINRMAAMRLSKQIAYEVARSGITLNTIATGSIESDTARSFWGDRARDRGITFAQIRAEQTQLIPVGRYGTPEDMADLCAYLCSDLSGFTTGESILCDGGKFIHGL